jgi:recombination associated protein RdgC
MWFKNLQIYSLSAGWTVTPAALEDALAKHPLLPVNAASMQSQGWVPPGPGATLVHAQGKQMMIALGIEQRLLPASVINHAAKQKAEELEKSQGFAPGRKQLREIKDRIADELRPRAFIRRRVVRAWLDLEAGRFIVDSTAPKLAEEVATVLRADLGELPAVALDTQQSPTSVMTAWVATGNATGMLAMQEDCELTADNAAKSAVRYVRHGLDGTEIRSLIGGGKTVTRLGMAWRERLSFVLTDKLAVKRVRFQNMDEIDEGPGAKKNAEDAFDTDFTLMTGELGLLLKDLIAALGGAKAA